MQYFSDNNTATIYIHIRADRCRSGAYLVHTHIAHITEHHHIHILSFVLQEGRTETAVRKSLQVTISIVLRSTSRHLFHVTGDTH